MQLTFINLSPDDLRQLLREEVERLLRQAQPNPVEKPYLSITQAEQQHGVSKSFLYRLSSNREVSTRRVGKSIQFDAKELENYFDKTAKRSHAAIEADLKKGGVFPTLKGKRYV
ncbi:helix-turn-helix domain-containing protein [Hymenobacter setariae]|uniref:Helix-turn-helix domain-containing protein n=1 Tax=Hymenobacter setariae TaxID=2594794 RepID=A0A558BMX3_9BACT|nr:helix-turn-helix domain-containing protein [Hymenobacter setariae]TVT37855.1 helix-turn-helix domain-containing protein [Hymenobacter setariae]